MNDRQRFWLLAASITFVLLLAVGGRPSRLVAIPLPSGSAVGDTPAPLSATATPAPVGKLVKYSGQLLDYRRGFVFFTTGDAYRLAPSVEIGDARTGGKTALVPQTRVYAVATFDASTKSVVKLGLSRSPLPAEATYDDIKQYAVALSTPYANPDLKPGEGFNGKPVLVTFAAEVPTETAFDAAVYVATDASGWSATAIRMDRVDSSHYQVTRTFASGTKLLYRYTLGSSQSSERGQNGLAVSPRSLTVKDGDVQLRTDVVYHWGTANEFDQRNDQVLPTPFNPIPFNTPPHR